MSGIVWIAVTLPLYVEGLIRELDGLAHDEPPAGKGHQKGDASGDMTCQKLTE